MKRVESLVKPWGKLQPISKTPR